MHKKAICLITICFKGHIDIGYHEDRKQAYDEINLQSVIIHCFGDIIIVRSIHRIILDRKPNMYGNQKENRCESSEINYHRIDQPKIVETMREDREKKECGDHQNRRVSGMLESDQK